MIGLFDSGVGGLTVAAQLRKLSPSADFVYFGDVAHAPYGSKPSEELFFLTLAMMRFLRGVGATEFVSACNSVSVSVIQPMIEVFGVPSARVIEMVEPAAVACEAYRGKNILVVATEATVRSKLYEDVFLRHGIPVHMFANKDLAFAIEEGRDAESIRQIIQPIMNETERVHADVLVFGCTHYPFVKSMFEAELLRRGLSVEIFDPSLAVATESVKQFNTNGTGRQIFFLSKESKVFRDRVLELFGTDSEIHVVDEHAMFAMRPVDNTLLD